MNQILIDFPERYQQNAFALWMENEGFALFQAYYNKKMPEENQPKQIDVEFDENEGRSKHFITIE